MNFIIESVLNEELKMVLQSKIDQKTKPIGALGTLEKIALQIGLIQNTDHPGITNPTIAVFAGDHGIAKKGEVNPYPQEVTSQMVYNFLNKGAAINVFCNQNKITLQIIDAGVNHNFNGISGLIDAKIDFGTKNYQEMPAMDQKQYNAAIKKGADIVAQNYKNGSNTIGFGEMGIGNTSAASLLMSYFTNIPIEECVGTGTGLSDEQVLTKKHILSEVYRKHNLSTPQEALICLGGFEIVMITGAILKAAELKMTIIIDGFIVTAALLGAHAMHPYVLDYCIFAHTSGEQGHKKMLEHLGKTPLINLGMRLGEGTGAAIAYPIIQSAVAFINNMASFESAGVSGNEN